VGQMMEAWRSEPRPNAVLTLMPVEPERLGNVGIVETDGPWVTRIVEKPSPEEAPSSISSLPLYCFSKRILGYLAQVPVSPRGEYELQDAIQMLIEHDGSVRGVTSHHRLTLTSPTDLLAINRHYLISGDDQPQLAPSRVGPNTRLVTPLRIERGTVIGRDCCIGPDAYIERDCTIGDGVVIRNAVVLRESSVADGALIENQVKS
jgi:NDP-sugar pyrophosphorylase family protein